MGLGAGESVEELIKASPLQTANLGALPGLLLSTESRKAYDRHRKLLKHHK